MNPRPISRCSRGFTIIEIAIVVAIIGIIAALAIPAYGKIAAASSERLILNNLRQISYGANNYFLMHGAEQVPVTALVGEGGYITSLRSVAGERYPEVIRADDVLIVAEGAAFGDVVFHLR